MKRLLSIVLSIIFTISFPVNSFAATADTITDEIIVNDPGLEKTPMILTDEELDMSSQGKTDISLFASFSSEIESNNTMGTADNITLSSGRRGSISTSTDIDWYKFTPSNSGKYRFDLINIPQGEDYDLYLYDANGSLIAQSGSTCNNEFIVKALISGTTYYLKVSGYDYSYSASDYYKIQVVSTAYAVAGWKYFFRNADSYHVGGERYYGRPSNHKGIDIAIDNDDYSGEPTENVYAYAVTSGTVKYSGFLNSAGYMVAIETNTTATTNGNKLWIRYLHLQSGSLLVSANDTVTSSTKLGLIGNTGTSDYAHLHFDVNTNTTYDGDIITMNNTINPELFFTSIEFTHVSPYSLSRSAANSPINNYDTIDLNYFFAKEIIDYVGSDNFDNWVNETPFEEQTIYSFMEYFNITQAEFENIVNDNSLNDIYDDLLK